jgi:hypothetical protein
VVVDGQGVGGSRPASIGAIASTASAMMVESPLLEGSRLRCRQRQQRGLCGVAMAVRSTARLEKDYELTWARKE